jgi:hypothetical protein
VSSATIANIAPVKEKKGMQIVVKAIQKHNDIVARIKKWWPRK